MAANVSEIGDLAFELSSLKVLGYVVSFRPDKGKKATVVFEYYIDFFNCTNESIGQSRMNFIGIWVYE